MSGESQQKTLVLENTSRRDALIAIESKYQKLWEEEKLFDLDAPEDTMELTREELNAKYPKFFGGMAYPYMNGVLHAGHAFTLSKVEFAIGYERMLGKRALFPFGYHCTGLPIKASADKLVREVAEFGTNFDKLPVEEETAEPEPTEEVRKADPTKFKAQKSKVAAKKGNAKYQFEIMLQLGIPREEVHKFADASHWIDYFPPLCEADCRLMGTRVDWRRSFVTTDWNPYYDSFVHWQMNALKKADKIKFGKRYTIFSPKDNQPCMDHDRQSGEGVGPQEYVGIKIRVLEFPEAVKLPAEVKTVDLVAATLRPETMYGQTCCFVSPKINYGVFPTNKQGEYILCTERAYRNMCYQDLTPQRGDWTAVAWVSGKDIIGSRIHAPLAQYPDLRVLPMETILEGKGTGVVTCVPSDSPDDYVMQMDLARKPEWYGIDPSWLRDPVPVLESPTYGNLTAKTLVEKLKIQSPKDKDLLAQAKEAAYKEGFYHGKMAVGKYIGRPVEEVKSIIRDDMVKDGDAFVYSEPEGVVVSRSGDHCVVSLQDQWFTNYGEPEWRKQAEECLAQLETYTPELRSYFEAVLNWMHEWALSRTYGLGSKIPWDPQYLVESLSDSTIYMAFYTVCHLLHSDTNGHVEGPLGISAAQMTDEVWDYVFFRTSEAPKDCGIDDYKLEKMRQEFRYFYPLDVQVSAKDLVPNHLTFFLYCHTALFPREFWPRSVRCNGHLMLNNEKMSKSTGNFMTLRQMLQKFGTDATRIALADSGDTTEDANFDEAVANAAILRLSTLKDWLETVKSMESEMRAGAEVHSAEAFFDNAFEAEMDEIIRDCKSAYDHAQYKQALKRGLFDLQIARDYYRDVCQTLGTTMRRDLTLRYAEVQALLLLPIAPHFAEWVWRELLGKSGSVQNALFPKPSKLEADTAALEAVAWVRDTSRAVREAEGGLLKKAKKGKATQLDPKKPTRLDIYVASVYPEWQTPYVDLVREHLESLDFKDMTGTFKKEVAKLGDPKRGMQFVNTLRQRVLATTSSDEEQHILDRKLDYDEVTTAKAAYTVLSKSAMATNVVDTVLVHVTPQGGRNIMTGKPIEVPSIKAVADAVPGSPGISLTNLE